MSILAEARAVRQGRTPGLQRTQESPKPNKNAKILDLSKLEDYIHKVMEFHKTKEENVDGNRSYYYVWEVDIANVLGYTDEPGWVFSIESAIEFAIQSQSAVQPNGRWKLYQWEIAQEEKIHSKNITVGQTAEGRPETMEINEPRRYMSVGMKFVDILGELDMIYEMGHPKKRSDNMLDPKVLRSLVNRSDSDNGSSGKIDELESRLAEQAKENKDLREEQRKTNEMLAALVSEMQAQNATPKKTTRGRK